MYELLNNILWIFGLTFVLLIFILFAVSSFYLARQSLEKKKEPWQQLAQTHNLRFVFDHSLFSQGSYVTGSYHGCRIKLETTGTSDKDGGTYTRLTIIWPNQPTPVLSPQEALHRFNFTDFKYTLKSGIKAEPGGKAIYYEQLDVIQDIKFLEYLLDILTGMAEAYPVVVNLGGEAMPMLAKVVQNRTLQPIARQLISDIVQETSKQLAHRTLDLLCTHCFTRFGPHKVDLPGALDPIYYGCRTCGQSRKYLEGTLIAVLDSQRGADPTEYKGVIRVNWSARRELFDFEGIEIINATDEEVERFAVQVGNDTDELRKPRYKEMTCIVNPQCELSENSLRILRRMFGQVSG